MVDGIIKYTKQMNEMQNSEEDVLKTKTKKHPNTYYISLGYQYLNLGLIEKAIGVFNIAIEDEPTNKRALLGRAKSLLKLCKYKEAKDEAQKLLLLSPKNIGGVALKAECDFMTGDFESSFLTYWRGFAMQPHLSECRRGYQMCQKALENALKPDHPVHFSQSDVQDLDEVLSGKCMLKERKNKNRRGLIKRDFSSDRKLLDLLLSDDDIRFLHQDCQELKDFLNKRKRLWRMQNPNTKVIFDENGYRNASKQTLESIQMYEPNFQHNEVEDCIRLALATMDGIDESSDKEDIDLQKLKSHSLHVLGLAYMSQNKYSTALDYFNQELKIAEQNNLRKFRKKGLFGMGEAYLKNGEFENALESFRLCMELEEILADVAILLYKIADCEVGLGNLDDARSHGTKALQKAEFVRNFRLQFDTCMLLGEIAIRKKDMKTTRVIYQDALEIAKLNGDSRWKNVEMLISMLEDHINNDEQENYFSLF